MARLGSLALVAAVLGFWAGTRWSQGAKARHEQARQQAYIVQLQRDVDRLRANSVQALMDYAAAAGRLDDIADALEQDREQTRLHAERQRTSLAALLDSQPRLRSQPAGDDLLQHWNRSNAGRATAPAAPADPLQPGAAMPAAAGGRR
ncbi:hypothetical protein [Stenotrophomonas sp. 364]|uniref:hypothetical protein n=1 Tax=Stenotrophomonas sp. 364 TaxID=2691571 RepID=UPI0013163F0F|nr:hypothetical protein [Stenotrophomonas sp. 364]QHB72922.1 hypothetical protein GQ674_17215 [Stenotrophomonas sp. 364]